MKVLYLYDAYPAIYQHYLLNTLELIKQKLPVSVLTYNSNAKSNYHIKSFGKKDKLQRFLYKLRIASSSETSVKIMRNYDIVHLQHSFLFPKLKGLLALPKDERPKIIITLRGGDTYVKPWLGKKWVGFIRIRSIWLMGLLL